MTIKIKFFILLSAFSILSAFEVFSQNCSVTSVGYPPINDLGLNYWRGYQGGLYPNGSNTRPPAHNNGGMLMSSQVRPLDVNGNYDPVNGKIVWLSIGMSNTTMETQAFIPMVDTFWNKNPKLKLIDGAQGGQHINIIIDSTANFWNVILTRLAAAGLSKYQVQVVWFKQAEPGPSDTSFPNYALTLKNKFGIVMRILKNKYPNIKLCYLSSRIYAGYATSNLNPEPYAYHSGWSVKWLIQDQINGDTNLTYTGNNPKSPWLSWGPYIWADGIIPRIDGLTWLCPADFNADGTHPSPAGCRKVAAHLFQFFTTDQTTVPFFLNNPLGIEGTFTAPGSYTIYQNYPNPFNPTTKIKFQIPVETHSNVSLRIYDILGREVAILVNEQLNAGIYEVDWDAVNYPSGVYYYKLIVRQAGSSTGDYTETKKMVLVK